MSDKIESEKFRPSVIYRSQIRLFKDGNKWCALYGRDLQNGIAGFGDSPEEARLDFDKQWPTKQSNMKIQAYNPDFKIEVVDIDIVKITLSVNNEVIITLKFNHSVGGFFADRIKDKSNEAKHNHLKIS